MPRISTVDALQEPIYVLPEHEIGGASTGKRVAWLEPRRAVSSEHPTCIVFQQEHTGPCVALQSVREAVERQAIVRRRVELPPGGLALECMQTEAKEPGRSAARTVEEHRTAQLR